MAAKEEDYRAVSVVIPEVKLQINDLVYLRDLARPKVKGDKTCVCKPSSGTVSRLRVFVLIHDVTIPPSQEEIEQRRKTRQETGKKLIQLMRISDPDRWDWKEINNVHLYTCQAELRERTETQITDEGRKLLKSGVAQVQLKSGCR